MKTSLKLFTAGLLLASAGSALADVRYVDVNSTNASPPYTNWTTAASNIQDAVDAAVAGDEIAVTNGIYATGGRTVDGYTTNRVAVDKPLSVRSINGPQFTTINGGGTVRCAYLTNSASLSGFTLTNGFASDGGGLWCESTNAVVSNCILSGNSAFNGGAGALGGTLNDCMVISNLAQGGDRVGRISAGGGANGCTLNNCVLSGNTAWGGHIGYGGGAADCMLNNCTLTGNSARGEIHPTFNSFGGGAFGCTLNNCVLNRNWASWGGGANGSKLNNCTLTDNTATGSGGVYGSTLNNSVVYYNSDSIGGGAANYDSSSSLNYCCTTPQPTNGLGNITNEPAFVNLAAGNFHLSPDSPCIDAGTNLSASITNDLDGRPRPLDGNGDGVAAFDMGVYEYRAPLLVSQDSPNPTAPYLSWPTAATNIQDAVDAAVAGDEIVVTNGTYAPVAVDRPLSLRSINGPQLTTINGGGSVRCVYLTNGASLSGFTLTKGNAIQGGGLWCESTNAVVSNCVLSDNEAGRDGGGAHGGTLNNCTLNDNLAWPSVRLGGTSAGGGANGCTLNNCILTGNTAWGAYFGEGGGAAYCTLNNCMLTGNWARGDLKPDINSFGGGAFGCTLNNCVLNRNWASWGGGANASKLNNCTLTDNTATGSGGVYGSTLNNCVVYYNSDSTRGIAANYDSSCNINFSCTMPQPTNGLGNITNEPAFVNLVAGNFHLRPDSPCIDAGTNLSASINNDLDGRPRPLDGNGDGFAAFDMGAYEYRTPLLVSQDSPNPTAPYMSWSTAATNIQDAVDAAETGDEIVVTNGIYAVVAMDKPITLRSISGPQFTTIDGGGSLRCVYLNNGASLSGFTLTNGAADVGGGVFSESTNALVSNCVLTGNSANSGGGADGCTLNNCVLTGNSAWRLYPFSAYGGGAAHGVLNNCTLSGNGAYAPSCRDRGDAFGGGAAGCTLNNCTLTANSAVGSCGPNGGRGGGAYGCALNNCTVDGNSADSSLVNSFGGGVLGCTLHNCIVYSNTAYFGANYDQTGVLQYCCTTPDPGGLGNITNAPLFVDQASGNLRLQSNSPCINAGLNAFAPAGPDLAGNPRIKGGTVDIGAYEFQSPASIISYAWLQQYALPMDGSADTADPDGDGMTNWQEWRCGSDPTNALSALRLLAPARVGSGVLVRWESVADRTYFLERSTTPSPGFTPLATGIPGQHSTTTYTDTNAVGGGPWFYRVGVSSP